MKARHFINKLEHDAIVGAIAEAERKMHGEIRVFISRKEPPDVVAAAQEAFVHLGMDKTRMRNGVLIYVAPRAHKFAVIGDTAVHAKCGEEFWKEVVEEMAAHFRGGQFTEAIIHGIRRAGKLLSEHFPHHRGDTNQLSNEIVED